MIIAYLLMVWTFSNKWLLWDCKVKHFANICFHSILRERLAYLHFYLSWVYTTRTICTWLDMTCLHGFVLLQFCIIGSWVHGIVFLGSLDEERYCEQLLFFEFVNLVSQLIWSFVFLSLGVLLRFQEICLRSNFQKFPIPFDFSSFLSTVRVDS